MDEGVILTHPLGFVILLNFMEFSALSHKMREIKSSSKQEMPRSDQTFDLKTGKTLLVYDLDTKQV